VTRNIADSSGSWNRPEGITVAVDEARLDKFPLFAGLNDEQRHLVASKLGERTAEPGLHLTSKGGGGYFFFLIDEGTAEVTRDATVVAELGPGDFFGEASLLEHKRRNANVIATSHMRLLELFGADFVTLTEQIPEMGTTVRAALEAHHPPA
jgi:CPA1 family monovalent cation:H+ antiporter